MGDFASFAAGRMKCKQTLMSPSDKPKGLGSERKQRKPATKVQEVGK